RFTCLIAVGGRSQDLQRGEVAAGQRQREVARGISDVRRAQTELNPGTRERGRAAQLRGRVGVALPVQAAECDWLALGGDRLDVRTDQGDGDGLRRLSER